MKKLDRGQMEQITDYNLYYLHYTNVALNLFKWEGLPTLIKEEYIEESLFYNGYVAFFRHENLGVIALPCVGESGQNVFGEYVKYRVNGFDGYNTTIVDGVDGVVIKNNKIAMPTEPYINSFAEKLSNIETTLSVNVSQQKHPYIIKASDKNILSMKNIFKKVVDNAVAIFVDKSVNMKDVEVFPTLAPFIGIEMNDYKNQVTNQLLTFLGLNNANTDKKERLVTNEVDSNNEIIENNFNIMLSEREKACEKINKMFGLSISVKARNEVENIGTNDVDDTTNSGE